MGYPVPLVKAGLLRVVGLPTLYCGSFLAGP
jgi:hypothetical protein